MGCGESSVSTWKQFAVWSYGDTTTAVFHPSTRVRTRGVTGLRQSFEFTGQIGQIKVKRAWRGSNDGGFTWSAVTELGQYVTTEATWSEGSLDTPDTGYELVEYGLVGVEASGTAMGAATVRIRIDQRNK